MRSLIRSRRWGRVILLASGASVIVGCGRSVHHTDSGGAGFSDGGAGAAAGSETRAGAGGTVAGEMNASGAGVGGIGGSAAGRGSFGGEECRAIQEEAELVAEKSCQQDSDCVRPPHMVGDCTDCGVVTNTSSTESSLDAARLVCELFYENGCMVPKHSCPAYRPSCVSTVCVP
jgi:hypothetical protein